MFMRSRILARFTVILVLVFIVLIFSGCGTVNSKPLFKTPKMNDENIPEVLIAPVQLSGTATELGNYEEAIDEQLRTCFGKSECLIVAKEGLENIPVDIQSYVDFAYTRLREEVSVIGSSYDRSNAIKNAKIVAIEQAAGITVPSEYELTDNGNNISISFEDENGKNFSATIVTYEIIDEWYENDKCSVKIKALVTAIMDRKLYSDARYILIPKITHFDFIESKENVVSVVKTEENTANSKAEMVAVNIKIEMQLADLTTNRNYVVPAVHILYSDIRRFDLNSTDSQQDLQNYLQSDYGKIILNVISKARKNVEELVESFK